MDSPTERSKCFFCCKEDGKLLRISDEVLGSKLGELLASIGNFKVVPLTPATLQASFCPACVEDVALAEEIISKVRQMLDVPIANTSRNPDANFTYECIEEECTFATLKSHMLRRHHARNHRDSLDPAIFKCPHCDKRHNRPSTLHKHIYREHINESADVKVEPPGEESFLAKRQYQCTKCDYTTKSAKVFKKHHRTKHGDTELRIFPCPYCREVYQRAGALHSHVGVRHKMSGIHLERHSVKTEAHATPLPPKSEEANDSSMLNVTQTSAIEFITDSDADESNMQCDGDVSVLMSEDIYTRLRQVNEARKRKASLNSTDSSPVKATRPRKETKAKGGRAAKLGGKAAKLGKKNAEAQKRSKDDGGIVKFLKFCDKNEKPNGNDENAQLNGIENEKDKDQSGWGENSQKEQQDDSDEDVGNNQKELENHQKDLEYSQKDLEESQKGLEYNQKDLEENQKDLEKNNQEDPEENNQKGLKKNNKKSPEKYIRKSNDKLSPSKDTKIYTTRRNSKKESAKTHQMEELDAMSVSSPVKIPQIGKLYLFNEDTEEEVEPAKVGVPPKRAEAVKFLKFPDADVNPIEDDKDVDATEDEGLDDMKSSPVIADDSEAARFLKFTLTQESSSQPVKDNGIKFLKFSDNNEDEVKEKEDEAKEKEDEAKEKEDEAKEKEDEAKEKEDDESSKEDELKGKESQTNSEEDEFKGKENEANSKKDKESETIDKRDDEMAKGGEVMANGGEAIEEVIIKEEPPRDSDSEEFVAASQRAKKKRSDSFARQAAAIKFAKFKDSPVNNDSVPSSGLDTPEKESKPTISCTKCPFITQSRKRYARHEAQAHGSRGSELLQSPVDPSTSLPTKKRKRSIGDDQSAVKASKRISCSGCEKSFKTSVKLHAHLVSDHAMVEVHQQLDYQSRKFTLY